MNFFNASAKDNKYSTIQRNLEIVVKRSCCYYTKEKRVYMKDDIRRRCELRLGTAKLRKILNVGENSNQLKNKI